MRVAYLHGFLGDASVWDGIAPASAIRVDLPGHGGGRVRPTWDANLEVIAKRVAGCDAVVGYSLGARVALGLLAAKQISRAILISVNAGIDDAERPVRRDSDARWVRLLRSQGLVPFLEAWEAQPLFATQTRAAPERRLGRRMHRVKLDREQLARSLETMGLAEMPDYRALVDERVTLIVGSDDDKFRALASTLPARTTHVITSCGHDPTLEQPAALAALLDRELR